MPTPGDILAALRGLAPAAGRDLAGLVTAADIAVDGGRVFVTIPVGAAVAETETWELLRRKAEQRLAALPGVTKALVTLTAERSPSVDVPGPAARPAALPPQLPRRPAGEPRLPKSIPALAGVRSVVAVASGKGGVGKSTTACNLALALAARGLAVGVLDADIYGPSMPKLFGLKGQPRIASGRTLIPLEAYGCKVMSIGFVVEADNAMIWRGPMVASAITQMLRDVAWGALDVLVVDMPPGTGDAQLTLAQQTPLAGAVVVSTPQDLSLIDARRGIAMFRNVGVPVFGIVENMSYFVCDDCGKRHHIFAHGGARSEASKLGVPFLGEVPLDPLVRERSDAGLPIVVTAPDAAAAKAYAAIAAAVAAALVARS